MSAHKFKVGDFVRLSDPPHHTFPNITYEVVGYGHNHLPWIKPVDSAYKFPEHCWIDGKNVTDHYDDSLVLDDEYIKKKLETIFG
jgi:hypothetical protein